MGMRFYKLEAKSGRKYYINPSDLSYFMEPIEDTVFKQGYNGKEVLDRIYQEYNSMPKMVSPITGQTTTFDSYYDLRIKEFIEKKIMIFYVCFKQKDHFLNDEYFLLDKEAMKMISDLGYPEDFIWPSLTFFLFL